MIFDEVSMSYSGAEEAISNISFVVKRGETVGVTEEPDPGNRRWSI